MAFSSFSSSSPSVRKFTVFLSFRGADTRRTFVSFLHKELVKNGIETFKDDKELESGSSISPELRRAIEESKFAILVMSENYASSGWCLEELTRIMECHEKGTLTAIPVFYGVEPSDVRRQTGKFAQHFKEHEGRENPEKVQSWGDALTKLANLSGECSKDWEDDSELVEKIVKDILDRFISATPSDFSGLVGMDVRMKAMHPLLDLESKDGVRVIGIWGMGGIGKTTLARCVYEKISRHFQTHCFLENIKKIYQDGGPSRLQEELLSKTQGRALTVRSSYLGFNVIKSMLGHQRVLLVVDDADRIEQLDALAKERSWFGPGSRVIVTTRDKHLLDARGVKHVYEVECLEDSEALQLFSQSAFRDGHFLTGFEQLSNRAVKLAGGLPLALALFGSFLSGRTKEDWKRALNRLERSPHKDIMEILKISYEGLDERDKSIFLRIACFFNYRHVDHVTSLVDDNVERAKFGIRVLVDRSLIALSSDGLITVHDLVRRMGKKLAGQQSPDESRKRLILSESDEICDALSDELCIGNLKRINMAHSVNLKEFPNLSNAPNLEQIIANGCESLTEIPSSVCGLSKLTGFHLYQCHRLEHIPYNLDMESLQVFNLFSCFHLKVFPHLSRCIKEVYIHGKRQRELSESIGYLPHLKILVLADFELLENLPDTIGNLISLQKLGLWGCHRLQRIPETIGNLISLQTLGLSGCYKLQKIPETIRKLKSLVDFIIEGEGITKFPNLPENVKKVSIAETSIEEIPSWIGDLYYLESLYISDNEKLKCLPASIYNLKALQKLHLWHNPNMESFSARIFGTTNCFGELNLEEMGIRIPPLSKFANLTLLEISRDKKSDGMPFHCPPLSSFPFLEELRLTYLDMLQIPEDLGQLTHLHVLDLSGNDFEKIPANIRQLTKLENLCINSCENLRSLSELPPSTIKLTAQGCVALEKTKSMLKHPLQSIMLTNCFKLKGDKHVTSGHWYREFACLPGGKVPTSFNYRSMGHSLKINLPGETNSSVLGLAACIVVAFEDSSCFDKFMVGWTCKCLRGNSSEIVLNYEFDPWSFQLPKDVAFQSDHLFLFKRDRDWNDDTGAVFDEVEFEFRFEIVVQKGVKFMFSPLEVQECGVSLYFQDDLKVGGERSSPHFKTSSNPVDEQSAIKLNAPGPTSRITGQLNNAISSSLSLTCDSSRVPEETLQEAKDANRKRSRGSIDKESVADSQEEEKESSSRKSKYIKSFI